MKGTSPDNRHRNALRSKDVYAILRTLGEVLLHMQLNPDGGADVVATVVRAVLLAVFHCQSNQPFARPRFDI